MVLARDGDELFDHYRHALEALGSEKGALALIFCTTRPIGTIGSLRSRMGDPLTLSRRARRERRRCVAGGTASEGIGSEGRWRCYDYDGLITRDKVSLDIFWLKDDSLADSDNLPPPDVIAQEIVK